MDSAGAAVTISDALDQEQKKARRKERAANKELRVGAAFCLSYDLFCLVS